MHLDTDFYPQQSTIFQGEAEKVAQILHISRPTFLTDNQVLARTAAARRLNLPLLHWNAIAYLADCNEATTDSSPQVFHVSRSLNVVAHNCTAQVLMRSLNQPIYRCSNSAHSIESCPVMSITQNVRLQDFVHIAVWCS